jgi:hypothetical protein
VGRVYQAQEHTSPDHVLLCFPAAVVLVVAPAVVACGLLPVQARAMLILCLHD